MIIDMRGYDDVMMKDWRDYLDWMIENLNLAAWRPQSGRRIIYKLIIYHLSCIKRGDGGMWVEEGDELPQKSPRGGNTKGLRRFLSMRGITGGGEQSPMSKWQMTCSQWIVPCGPNDESVGCTR